MIKKITKRLRKSGGGGLLHDSRMDVRTLMDHNNILQDKINELVDTVNLQGEEIQKLRRYLYK